MPTATPYQQRIVTKFGRSSDRKTGFWPNTKPGIRSWISSLETLSRLNATTIIPGHGEVQHDQTYLNLVLISLQTIHGQVQAALQRGLTLKQTQQSVNLDAIRVQFTHDDPKLNASFDGNFFPIIRQMYDEETEGLELYQ